MNFPYKNAVQNTPYKLKFVQICRKYESLKNHEIAFC